MSENMDIQDTTKISCPDIFISKLLFNDSTALEIKQNDIVVFVGSNNVGKSQSLRDIWDISEKKESGIVINNIVIQQPNSENIKKYLPKISLVSKNGVHSVFSGMNFSFHEFTINGNSHNHLEGLRNAFFCYLRTDDRLSICNPPEIIDRTEVPRHPIHQIVKNRTCRTIVTEYFQKAFGIPLVPNSQHGKTIPLCLGAIPLREDSQGVDAQAMVEWYAEQLEKYPQLHLQGDGMRSFAGILLYLSMDNYRTFLLDEPESFLHPPQATIMGHVVAERLSDTQQAFISTHSQHFIKGLLEKAPDRVKIIRITRTGDKNNFAILDNDKIQEIWNDPLLKYSEIMDGMFYKNVIVCESDADCRFYSIINGELKTLAGAFSESLFVHCGGKARLGKVVQALKSLNIDFRVIPDIDILNQESVFKELIEICGGTWDSFSSDYHILCSGLETAKNDTGKQLLEKMGEQLSECMDAQVSRSKLENLKKLMEYKSKWDFVKHSGISGAPQGDATRSLKNIIEKLKPHGIFIVPVGELECFIKEVGGHGPGWLNDVLEKYPDFNNSIYDEARKFVASWNI